MTNYFDHFDLQVSFNVDQDLLRKAFLVKSREFHPDLNSDSDEEKILELSAYNNTAYNTLKDEMLTVRHVLSINNISLEDTLPNEFLMEMMELNEQIDEAKNQNDTPKIQLCENFLNDLERDFREEWERSKKLFSNDLEQGQKNEILKNANMFLVKMKYLKRMRNLLNGILEI